MKLSVELLAMILPLVLSLDLALPPIHSFIEHATHGTLRSSCASFTS